MRYRIKGYDNPVDLLVSRTMSFVFTDSQGYSHVSTTDDVITIGNTEKFGNKQAMLDVSPGFANYNPVSHSKVTYKGDSKPEPFENISNVLITDPDGSERYVPLKSRLEFSHYDAAQLPFLPGPSYASGAKFTNDVIQKATEQFGTEVSIANFLYELRDAASLFVRDWALRLLLGKIGSSYLSWQFGWKPMLQDIMSLRKIASKVRARLEYLKKTNEKYVTEKFRVTIREQVDDPPGSLPDRVVDSPILEHRYRDCVQTEYRLKELTHTFVAHVVVNRHLEGLDDSLAFAKGLENALGLDNLPAVAWEATPFSWMVEWFLNITRPLAAFDVEPFKGTTRIISVHHSVKTVGTYAAYGGQVEVDTDFPDTLVPVRVVNIRQLGSTKNSTYQRKDGLPPTDWIFLEDSFTGSQLAILLALLAAAFNR